MAGQLAGKNSEMVQQQNRLLVLRLIRIHNVISRVRLAELTGLKQATITNIVNDLMQGGYVTETGLIKGDNGRRVKGLMLNNEKMGILVSRINSDYFAAGIYDLYGKCLQVEKVFWDGSENFEQMLEKVLHQLLTYKTECSPERVLLGTGIVIGGDLFTLYQSFMNLDITTEHVELEQYLKKYFEDSLGMSVMIGNPSGASAYLEYDRAINRGEKINTLVGLMISSSIDCAIIFNGQLQRGRNGQTSHFGHVSIDMNGPLCECGNRGCIKNYLSVKAVKKQFTLMKSRYPSIALDEDCNIRDLIKAYYDRDSFAIELWDRVAEILGLVIANLINQLSPEEVIFGDEVPNDAQFLETVKRYARMRLPEHRYNRTEIKVFTEMRKTENDVGMVGMCLFVINEKLKDMKLDEMR